MRGGTASQNGNLAQLSKVSKEKPFLNASGDYAELWIVQEVYTKNYGIINQSVQFYPKIVGVGLKGKSI